MLAGYDVIGCMDMDNPFTVSGSCTELLYGACESFYKDDMNPDQLFEVISQSLLNAMDRDILSGWGANVYVLTPTELIIKKLLTRVD